MKRCTYCFRYSRGTPTFCSHCGRTYNVRICNRGHLNPRGVAFCAECGSSELSTPAPPAGFLFVLSQWTLRVFVFGFAAIVVLSLVAALLQALLLPDVAGPLLVLLLMLGFLYWTTTLLPGPIRKVGKAAGRGIWNAIANKQNRR